MKKLIILLFLTPFLLFSQEKGSFKLNFDGGFQTYNLKKFNQLLNDYSYVHEEKYDSISLKKGWNFGLDISYAVIKPLSIGIYGNYQYTKGHRNTYFDLEYEPDKFVHLITRHNYSIQSYSLGLSTSLILNNFNFWVSKNRLSKLEFLINLQIGYSFIYFNTIQKSIETPEVHVDDKGSELYNQIYKANGFQIIPSIRIGYILTNNNYFSSIGLKLGYQLLFTSPLKRGPEGTLTYSELSKLNLSGLSIGIYLTLGR